MFGAVVESRADAAQDIASGNRVHSLRQRGAGVVVRRSAQGGKVDRLYRLLGGETRHLPVAPAEKLFDHGRQVDFPPLKHANVVSARLGVGRAAQDAEVEGVKH